MQPLPFDQLVQAVAAAIKAQSPTGLGFLSGLPWVSYAVMAVFGLFCFCLLLGSFFTVDTSDFAIVERFGKYRKTASEGLNFKFPIIDQIAYEGTYQISGLDVSVETITSDKVTVVIEAPVQYQVIKGREYDAEYKLVDVEDRIKSLTFDEIRSRVPKMTLHELFNSKDDVATSVREEMQKDLERFGYSVDRVMITDVEPCAEVKAAMNAINASQKQGEADLAKATNEQRVQIEKAKGRLESATLNKEAEIIDAEAVAKSVDIIGKALHENEGFLRYHWIKMMENRDAGDTIYVPTEAGLPILEAGKRS